jgi:hypothetical protein
MTTSTPEAKVPNYETEYVQAMSYIQHMYNTRHQIFQFVVALNTGILVGVFQFAHSARQRAAFCGLCEAVTLAITLMARRSQTYLHVLEEYTRELEERIGCRMVRNTTARMPKGLNSTQYLFFVYWALVLLWGVVGLCYLSGGI